MDVDSKKKGKLNEPELMLPYGDGDGDGKDKGSDANKKRKLDGPELMVLYGQAGASSPFSLKNSSSSSSFSSKASDSSPGYGITSCYPGAPSLYSSSPFSSKASDSSFSSKASDSSAIKQPGLMLHGSGSGSGSSASSLSSSKGKGFFSKFPLPSNIYFGPRPSSINNSWTYLMPCPIKHDTHVDLRPCCSIKNLDKYFDAPNMFGLYPVCLTEPFSLSKVTKCANAALRQYNGSQGTYYQFVEIERANSRSVAGLIYYITFKARSPQGILCSFQALVYDLIEELTVARVMLKSDDGSHVISSSDASLTLPPKYTLGNLIHPDPTSLPSFDREELSCDYCFTWTKYDVIPLVVHQREHLCSAVFACAALLSSIYCISTGDLVVLSKKEIINNLRCVFPPLGANYCDCGCYFQGLSETLEYLSKFGVCEEFVDQPEGFLRLSEQPEGFDPRLQSPPFWRRMYINHFLEIPFIPNDDSAIRMVIHHHPIVAVLANYPSFISHEGFGVYSPTQEEVDVNSHGNHVVLVTGLGSLDGVNYYEIQNSLGLLWGFDGFGKVRRDLFSKFYLVDWVCFT